jgi:phenylacetate-CoA ligase
MVRHAYQHVPYYRETMRRLGLGPADFESVEDLAKLPLIERDQLQRDPEYFVSRAEPLAKYVELHTSGSTGEPITFFRHTPRISQQVLGFDRMEPMLARLSGKRWRRRDAVIVPPRHPDQVVDDAPRVQWLGLHVRAICRCFSVFDPPAKVAPRLDEFRPHLVKSYGSYLEELYTHLAATGRSFHRPNVVTYAGDPISEPVRRLMAEHLGIAVLSVYQAVEVGIIGWECERQCGHHLNVDLYPIRIVDSNRREVPIGDPGQIVASNLVNRGTVLLHYLLGDLARRLPEPCECGRSLPLLSLVEGRATDWLRSASGRPVHPQTLRSVMSQLRGVRRYQLVQERAGHVKVVAVTVPGADREEIRSLIAAAGGRLEDPMDAEVEFSETLPRTEGGKVRTLLRQEVGGQTGPTG